MDTTPQNPAPALATVAPAPVAENPTFPVAANAPEDSMAALLQVLRQGERFLVCSHSRPDGDAVGSMLAMGMLLEQMGKRADLVTADSVPAIYRWLPGAGDIRHA